LSPSLTLFGSFVKYLYEYYGGAKVRELWKDASLKRLRRVSGSDVAALEKAWNRRLLEADATNVRYDFEMFQPSRADIRSVALAANAFAH
jgi:hypothetical protein